MKKNKITITLAFALITSLIVFSCKKEKTEPAPYPDNNPPAASEFIADTNTFLSYSTWTVQATNQGPDPALGMAHSGNDSTVVRMVHFKDGQNPVNGKYPVGTIIVKHSSNMSSVNELTAMVKRGNNFNPTKGDWEFFMLMPNGKIAKDSTGMYMRGANLMGGMCGSCHAGAANKDYIFSK